tara:strand:+ start:193 stop:507 length:315 start_codon:yes stop_codon:yes gene_type:complete
MADKQTIQKKWDGVERRNKKPKPKQISTGPDLYLGGDGLPDWMQFTITGGMFAILYWVLYLLFHPTLELDETHRDLLNIILGTFIATFGKTIDFWFRHSKKKDK